MKRTTAKRWKETVGKRPHRVTVRERTPGGALYLGTWVGPGEGKPGRMEWEKLGHRDRQRARAQGQERSAQRLRGEEDRRTGAITVSDLIDLYVKHATPRKKETTQKDDNRRALFFKRQWGGKEVMKLRRAEWLNLTDRRRSGEINARGEDVADPGDRRPVRDQIIRSDLAWFRGVLNWATKWDNDDGTGYLLRENRVRGFPLPKEENPKRPVATRDRYDALRAVSDRVPRRRHYKGAPQPERSYLSEILDLAAETGRRLSAILSLRYSDLHLEATTAAPHGAITWRADADKKGIQWEAVPINARARAALDRIEVEGLTGERPGRDARWLFPAPGKPKSGEPGERPMSRHLADKWLRRAEELAGLAPQEGSLWHAFRRMAATEYKGLPEKDVMLLIGWKDERSLKTCYEHADPAATLATLEGRRELREIPTAGGDTGT